MAKETRNNAITITLADGTQLSGLGMNGNNFISPVEVTEETFRGKLGKVVISGNAEADEAGLIGEHEHMELVQIAHYTLRRLTECLTAGTSSSEIFQRRNLRDFRLAEILTTSP